MDRRRHRLPLAAGVAACLLLSNGIARADTLALTGGTIIDGTGAPPIVDATVLVEEGRIVAVGPDVAVPADARTLDVQGKYLIPGLMDANVHLMINIRLETLIKYEDRYDEIVLEAAQIALKTGQTTVFDTWGPLAALRGARDAINAGEAPGSRIYLAGNIIGFGGPLSPDFLGAAAPFLTKTFVKRINETWEQGTGRDLMWMTPDDVRATVAEYAGKGMDFLKYGASGHTDMFFIQFSPRVQRAIVEEGHKAGMTVQAHTTSVESLDMAIDAGIDIVTHGDISGPQVPIPDETLKKLVDRGIPVSVLPITQRRIDEYAQIHPRVPGAILAPYMKIGRENQKAMIENGVTMLLSTDAGVENPVVAAESEGPNADPRTKLGEGHFNALAGLEELGMAPQEILRSATSHVAAAYRVDDRLGTLEPGKTADIVVLGKDPLRSAAHYREVEMVIKDGAVVNLDALPVAPVISSIPAPATPSPRE
ncbi:MAG: amidohydrolase family protein [Gammaproteobacteria bacterium]|nr:amidohydrolase family protein [Gammaproteobacteria bacterium]